MIKIFLSHNLIYLKAVDILNLETPKKKEYDEYCQFPHRKFCFLNTAHNAKVVLYFFDYFSNGILIENNHVLSTNFLTV